MHPHLLTLDMKKLLFIYFIGLLCSCSSRENPPQFAAVEGEKAIKYDSLSFCFFCLDTIEQMSPVGYLQMMGSEILFLERESGLLRIYDTLGRFIDKKLGFGRSRNEIMGSEVTAFGLGTNLKEYLIFDDLCYFVFDSNYILKKRGITESRVHSTPQSKVHGNNPGIYTWNYRNPIVKMYNDVIFRNVNISSLIHLVEEKEKYFSEGRTLMTINQGTGKVDRVFAEYPETYLQHNLCAFYSGCFDIDMNGFLFMSYEADSLIYQYDQKLRQIRTFGFSGNNMARDFRKILPGEDLGEQITEARLKNGFYKQIKCYNSHIVLRLYTRGTCDSLYDGLQIYEGTNLIGDVCVPKDFRIIGTCNNSIYFYRECPEENVIIIAKASLSMKG